MDGLRHLQADIAALEQAGLLRQASPKPPPDGAVDLRSNDYLGYAAQSASTDEPIQSGAGASRLVSGDHPAHRSLERALCEWLGAEAALVFTSGYAANVGLLKALTRPGDVVVSDALNHASIIDGCRLSEAEVIVVPHLDAARADQALRTARAQRPAGRRWLVTETYFSMNGTSPDLAELRRICDTHEAALIVDEAHALGVFGPRGTGLAREAGVAVDVLVGTLGKAFGLQGAFVAGSQSLRTWLWNRARSFVFSTGMSPWLAAVAHGRLEQVAGDDAARERLRAVTDRVRGRLAELRAPIEPSHGPIVPWLVGEPAKAMAVADQLRRRGVLVAPIRPPAVAPAKAIVRISLNAQLTDEMVTRALDAFALQLSEP